MIRSIVQAICEGETAEAVGLQELSLLVETAIIRDPLANGVAQVALSQIEYQRRAPPEHEITRLHPAGFQLILLDLRFVIVESPSLLRDLNDQLSEILPIRPCPPSGPNRMDFDGRVVRLPVARPPHYGFLIVPFNQSPPEHDTADFLPRPVLTGPECI
jgi:hypothetical protein